ncbi:MAG: MBL fold metallo-hydrolase [Candidatus Liptonbacteria bacterium]|nr:MBL fold metallo-hydrolase [Candidatus Liptonbacteria bacterium]
MKITFFGGAGTVTGVNYRLEAEGETGEAVKILVDCGLQQGGHFAEKQNFEPFPYDAKTIDFVLITHAHIDHIGLLPKLFRAGFRGKIFSTAPTRDFAELLLVDSEHILNKEAQREGKPPLYTVEDITAMMKVWEDVKYHQVLDLTGVKAEFYNAGHILGSAFIKITAEGKTIVFSGDLGNYPAPIIKETEKIPPVDYCLIESTYGDRVHERVRERREELEDAIEETVKKGGTLLIPAFAMERTQQLLFELNDLIENGKIPKVPVYIDSPLAIHLTEVYRKYRGEFKEEVREMIEGGDDILDFPGLHFTLTTEESKTINDVKPPKVIIAGSGMSHGGRILHHERRYLPDPNSMVLLVGYQGKGSLGRQIMEGAQEVTIMGERVPVRARVRVISGYSAHADQPKLVAWLKPARMSLKKVFVVQGEEGASEALTQKIKDDLAIHTEVPRYKDSEEL